MLVLVSISFVFGAFCLQQMPTLPAFAWALVFIPMLLALRLRMVFVRRVVALLLSFAFGFFWAAGFAYFRMSDALPHAWESKPLVITGVVASVPEQIAHGERFRFDVEQILTPQAVVPRHIALSFYAESRWGSPAPPVAIEQAQPQFNAGERWQLTVRLKRPHGVQNPHGFDFEAWALSEHIRATGSIKAKAGMQKLQEFVWRPSYGVERIRAVIKQRIATVLLHRPYLGVIQALVMGDDSQITTQDWQVFLRTGTSHLMSISGLHITMLAGLAFGLVGYVWRRVPTLATRLPARKAATLAGLFTALLYALVAGFAVPTQRTLYMLAVFAWALWSGRQIIIAQVLAIALLLVVLLDPWAVISAGFWLSFGAVALLSFALGGRIYRPHWLSAAVQTQWAVTIGMLPLLLLMFHQASVVSPIANALAIPIISFVVTPLALLGSLLPLDAPLQLAYLVLDGCMQALKWLNQSPGAVWQQHAPAIWTLLPALVGVGWLLLPRGVPMRWAGVLGFLPMLLISPARPAVGAMHMTVLDVGQGLSVVVQTATHTLLYDTGARFTEKSDAGARIVVPYLQSVGINKLDGLVVSHNDADHSGGMASVLALMPVDWLLSSLPAAMLPTTTKTMPCFASQHWQWDGVRFEVLHPTAESIGDMTIMDNNRSCVLKISSIAGSVLLTGDIEKKAEAQLVAQQAEVLQSDVLIAPHHGSKTSSTTAFIEAVAPQAVVFTSGYLNRFKHPAPKVVARYQAAGSQQFRSDYHGALMVDFANKQGQNAIKMTTYRSQYQRYWHDQYPAQ